MSRDIPPLRVLVAGIGGASLGTELLKCLKDAGIYTIFGCDISDLAYGHYQEGVRETFVVSQDRYIESIQELCVSHKIHAVIPGGEEPLTLLSQAAEDFQKLGVHIAANSPDVIAICSDKKRLFECLRELGLPMPWTAAVKDIHEFGQLEEVRYPCVIKPTTGSGGSSMVLLASNREEAILYLRFLLNNGKVALVQEYIPLDDGEFTVGVLSLPERQLVGSVAMRRLFHVKLSVSIRTETGLISSGYSQGLIDEFPEVRAQAEKIARAIGSAGPLNIQGRISTGMLIPFEINPRFSASTYLRAMAGFNEVDMYLRHLLMGEYPVPPLIRPGYYLRSFSEVGVNKEEVKR
jgi:carbamoyl-phosphate synthase large subunit